MAAFDTPDNEQSFSSLIDQAIRSTGRVGALVSAVGAANAAIRECQMLGLFSEDSVEEVIKATANPHVYETSLLHRTVGTVQYSQQCLWPKFLRPGRQQKEECHFYYKVDDAYVFKGPIIGEDINILSYYYQRRLSYYKRLGALDSGLTGGPYAVRPAYFDIDVDEWRYLVGNSYESTTGDPDGDEIARKKSSNWLVGKWFDMILEGTKGKLWSNVADDRGRQSYSLYKNYQADFTKTTYESENN